MKEYQEPTATIVEFSVKDIVICSGEPKGMGVDEETERSGNLLGANGMRFE